MGCSRAVMRVLVLPATQLTGRLNPTVTASNSIIGTRRIKVFRSLLILAILISHPTKSSADDALPDSVRKEFDAYVGTWEGTFDSKGQTATVKWTASWAPGHQCLIIHEEYITPSGENHKITAVMGYDSTTKHVVNTGFGTGGGNRTLTFDDGFTKGRMKGSGDTPDAIAESKFEIEKNATEWVFTFDGVSPPGNKMVIRLRKTTS